MSRWKCVVTNAGLNLLSNVTDSRAINIVAVKGGSDKVADGALDKQTNIVGYKCDMQIVSSIQTDETNYQITARLANDGVAQSFNLTQVGIFATLGNSTNEVLFMIMQCGDDGDVIPANTLSKGFTATYQINLAFSNTENVNVVITPIVEGLATVATSGSYNDLSDKPNLATVATSGNYNDLNDKPQLSTVATSGSYSDLNNKPELAAVATSGSYNDLNDKPNTVRGATVYTINSDTFVNNVMYKDIHHCNGRIVYVDLLNRAQIGAAYDCGLSVYNGSDTQGVVGINVTSMPTSDIKLVVVDLGAYEGTDTKAVVIDGLAKG